jgi:hypothetical protein
MSRRRDLLLSLLLNISRFIRVLEEKICLRIQIGA